MTTVLHLVFAEPGSASFRQALRTLGAGDAVVLAGHGVLAATRSDWAGAMSELEDAVVGALQTDLAERGLLRHVDEAIAVLDDDDWICWSLRHPLLRAWW